MVVAVIGVVDVENERARTGIERPQHPDPVRVDAQLLKERNVVARQRDHQVGVDVVDVDLRGAVVGGVAVGAQHPVGPLVGGPADVPARGSRAGHPHGVGQAALGDLVGEHLLRHGRPADVAGADEGDVQCSNQTPSAFRNSPTVATCMNAVRRSIFGEIGPTVTPADHHGVDAVRGRTLDVVAPVADHQHPLGKRLQLRQCVRDHVGFGRASAVDAGAGDHLEVPVEAEVREDALRGGLGLRGGHRQTDSGHPQVGEQRPDAVEQAVHRPAAGGVVGAVGGDRGVGVFAQPHGLERVMHRRSNDLAGQVALGHGGADFAERVAEARHDAVRGVGQGAVEVEDHQLRLREGDRCLSRPYCPRRSRLPVIVSRYPASRRGRYCFRCGESGVERVVSARGGALSRRPGRRARHA